MYLHMEVIRSDFCFWMNRLSLSLSLSVYINKLNIDRNSDYNQAQCDQMLEYKSSSNFSKCCLKCSHSSLTVVFKIAQKVNKYYLGCLYNKIGHEIL